MHRLHRWTAIAGILGLCGLGFACLESDELPSAEEREARSMLLRDLIASRERMPAPEELEAQRRDLQAEVGEGEVRAQGDAGQGQAAARITGTVEWVGDDELLVRDERGVEREVRVQEGTRFFQGDREVSRRTVEQGAEIRVAYDVEQEEWVAREVELLRGPALPPQDEGRGEGTLSRPSRGEPR